MTLCTIKKLEKFSAAHRNGTQKPSTYIPAPAPAPTPPAHAPQTTPTSLKKKPFTPLYTSTGSSNISHSCSLLFSRPGGLLIRISVVEINENGCFDVLM